MFWDHKATKNAQPPYQRMDARKSYVYYYTGVSLSGAQFGWCVFTRISATANSMLLTFDFDFPCIWEMNVWAVEWARFIFIAQFTRIFHFNLMVLSRILAERARQKDTLWMEFMCKNYQSLEDLLPPRGCFVYFKSDSLSLSFFLLHSNILSVLLVVYMFLFSFVLLLICSSGWYSTREFYFRLLATWDLCTYITNRNARCRSLFDICRHRFYLILILSLPHFIVFSFTTVCQFTQLYERLSMWRGQCIG